MNGFKRMVLVFGLSFAITFVLGWFFLPLNTGEGDREYISSLVLLNTKLTGENKELKTKIKLMRHMLGEKENYVMWILKYSKQYDLNPYTVFSLMDYESTFDRKAINKSSGCLGLMQIHPKYWPMDDYFNAEENIKMGCRILRLYLTRSFGDYFQALLRYGSSCPEQILYEAHKLKGVDKNG